MEDNKGIKTRISEIMAANSLGSLSIERWNQLLKELTELFERELNDTKTSLAWMEATVKDLKLVKEILVTQNEAKNKEIAELKQQNQRLADLVEQYGMKEK